MGQLNSIKSLKLVSVLTISIGVLAACTPVSDQEPIGNAAIGGQLSGDCKSQKQKLDQMHAKGQSNSKAYTDALDRYWAKCA